MLGFWTINYAQYLWCTLVDFSSTSPLENLFLEEISSVWAPIDITILDNLSWLIRHTWSDPNHKYEFSFKVAQVQSEKWTNFQSKI